MQSKSERDPKEIMTGNSDFRKIISQNGYYIDKTALVNEIISLKKSAYLFTRPRRFGKTLNLTMLDAYLNMRYADGPDLFKGLAVSELRPDDPDKNSNPVIYLSLKDLKSKDYGSFIKNLMFRITELYGMFPELENSKKLNINQKRLYSKIINNLADESDLRNSLYGLCDMLASEYEKQSIILIDEYDNAVNEADSKELREEMLEFMSPFLSAALKDNSSLRFAVVTGVMQIAKASIFSGLNNLYTDSIFDTRFEEYWGFSENEVRTLCADYGHPEKFEEAKEWYDGYRFGTRDTYNPWSVLSYVDRGFVPDTYWAKTSTNSILNQLYRHVDMVNFRQILGLLEGGSFETPLNTFISYDSVSSDDRSLYSVMAMTGYLNAVSAAGKNVGLGRSKRYRVSFPNLEVRAIMQDTVSGMMIADTEGFEDFCTAVIDGDTDRMEDILGKILVQGSYLKLTDETSYELVLMTVLYGIAGSYKIRTESEGGNGRIDIMMEAKRKGTANLIFELKKAGSKEELENAAEKAISQIHDRKYYLGMEGTVLLYGISFWGKIPCLKHDRIDLSNRYDCLRRRDMAKEYSKDFNAMLHDRKDMPKIEIVSDERTISRYGGNRMFFAPPIEYDRIMKLVPPGKLITAEMIRRYLAKTNSADFTDPLTAGIFISIAAWASYQRSDDPTPYWRTLKTNGELNGKYPGGIDAQIKLLESEGHEVVQKGHKNIRYCVVNYEEKLFEIPSDIEH